MECTTRFVNSSRKRFGERLSIAISVLQPGWRWSSGLDFSRCSGVSLALGRPVVDGHAGDRGNIIAGFTRHIAGAVEPFADPARTRVIGRGSKAEIAELAEFSFRNSADFGSACTGSNGSSNPRSAAVPGMNCAMPCARWPLRVTGPTASARKRLSCQITRAKNSTGRP